MADPILSVEGLHKSFGGLQAVKDVSFDVNRGAIKAVIGPNGAGKTTLFNMIAGTFPPSGGRVFFGGQDVTGERPFQMARRGLLRTFQNLKLCAGLSVLDNILLGHHTRGTAGFLGGMGASRRSRREEKQALEEVMPLLEWLNLTGLAHSEVGNLSFGQQRSVELARALAGEPSLLLLDEPAAGLNMHETEDLARRIKEIRDGGRTVLLVEHDMSLVMDICDEIAVLNFGGKIAEGIPREIQQNEAVIRVYLGGGEDA